MGCFGDLIYVCVIEAQGLEREREICIIRSSNKHSSSHNVP